MAAAAAGSSGKNKLSKRRLTVCVVGSGGVGKSSITLRYINGHFPEVNNSTYNTYKTTLEYLYIITLFFLILVL